MFCRFCGDSTDNQNGICDVCNQKPHVELDETIGFGKSLASFIIALSVIVFSFVGIFVVGVIGSESLFFTTMVFYGAGLVASIVLGILGLADVSQHKKGKKKELPLVFSILGLILDGTALVYGIVFFFPILIIILGL